MKNEQNPIDKLFADKLRDREVKPRPEAWERLAAKTGQKSRRKRRKFLLIFLLAGLSLAGSSAYYFLNRPAENRTEIPAEKPEEKPEETGSEKPKNIQKSSAEILPQETVFQEVKPEKEDGSETDSKPVTIAKTKEIEPEKSAEKVPAVREIKAVKLESAEEIMPEDSLEDEEEIAEEKAQDEAEETQKTDTLNNKKTGGTVKIIIKTGGDQAGHKEPEKKGSRFGRMLRELRKAKNGEPADLKEIRRQDR